MIDDGTFYRLLNYIAWRVFLDMDLGRPLTEIDSELQYDLSKKDCIALFKHMDAHKSCWTKEIAQLRALSKRPPQPTHPPATILH
jgi:hypothetical protein